VNKLSLSFSFNWFTSNNSQCLPRKNWNQQNRCGIGEKPSQKQPLSLNFSKLHGMHVQNQNTEEDNFQIFPLSLEINFFNIHNLFHSINVSFVRYCIRLQRSLMLSTFCILYQFQIPYYNGQKYHTSMSI
jgi:hypothetical protein